MTTVNKDPYVYIEDNVFNDEFCKHVINKFENDSRQQWGVTGAGEDFLIKKSKDLQITDLADWQQEDAIFHETLQYGITQYTKHINLHIGNNLINRTTNLPKYLTPVSNSHGEQCTDSGYQIQKTLPGDGYIWHNDFQVNGANGIRQLTFIFYLNDVDEGWTQFYNGDQVQPKAGRLLMFPATWTYVHQGYPPKQTKYLATGWIHESIEKINN
jgi:hypothetical protein